MKYKSESELELDEIEMFEYSLALHGVKSVAQKLKRFSSVQHLDVLFDMYFESYDFEYILKEVLNLQIMVTGMMEFLPNSSSRADAEKGKQLTTLGKMAIYITDPREPTSVPGQNLEQGINCFKEAMKLNYSDAYYSMGYLYHYGLTTPITPLSHKNRNTSRTTIMETDYQKAIEYYKQAIAVDNHPKALYQLAIMHLNGHGFEKKDIDKAKQLLERARALNYSDAIVVLGNIAYNEFSMEDAFQYYQEAAKLNNGRGMKKLAFMYFCVTGVEKDLIKACQLHRQAWIIDGNGMNANELLTTANAKDNNIDDKTKTRMKYHYHMLQAAKMHEPKYDEIFNLLRSNPVVVWDCIVGDTLLADEEKENLTDYSFKDISSVLEVERFLFRSLHLKNRGQRHHTEQIAGKPSYLSGPYRNVTHEEFNKKSATDFLKSVIATAYSKKELEQLVNEILNNTSPRINFLNGWIEILNTLIAGYTDELKSKVADLKYMLESNKNHLYKNTILFFNHRPVLESPALPNEVNQTIYKLMTR